MLIHTRQGLYCPPGDFYIDPSRGVENAVITHAHSDHARRGSQMYYCATSCASLLRARLGSKIRVTPICFGEKFSLGDVQVSLHPAGHILGSAQVRVEWRGEVWVASGDYKRDPDPTCEPFECVPCDVFITEATFGTPAYQWPRERDLGAEIYAWWQTNAAQGLNSVLFAYSLGKTQRVLGLLKPLAKGPIYCAPSAAELNACYRAEGIALAETRCLSEISEGQRLEGALVLAPQSFLAGAQSMVLGGKFRTAFASGWMATGDMGYDTGFPLSDHADWDGLLLSVRESGARRVYVQHRGKGALVRHLKSLGIAAFPVEELVEPTQLSLF
jgi:putative mRNA 3-end processing factor